MVCNHIECNKDKRKMCQKKAESIMRYFAKGVDAMQISQKFNISYNAVRKMTDEPYRKKLNLQSNEINKNRYSTDKKYREKQIKVIGNIQKMKRVAEHQKNNNL